MHKRTTTGTLPRPTYWAGARCAALHREAVGPTAENPAPQVYGRRTHFPMLKTSRESIAASRLHQSHRGEMT